MGSFVIIDLESQVKFGITETDADGIAEEVDEMLKYYRSISKDYLDFLEERANSYKIPLL